jgi:hypothetical protein
MNFYQTAANILSVSPDLIYHPKKINAGALSTKPGYASREDSS